MSIIPASNPKYFKIVIIKILLFVFPNCQDSKIDDKDKSLIINHCLKRHCWLNAINNNNHRWSEKSTNHTVHFRSDRLWRNTPQSAFWWRWMAAWRPLPRLWHPLRAGQPRQRWVPGRGRSAASGSRRCWSRCPPRGCSAQMTAREIKVLNISHTVLFCWCDAVKGGFSLKNNNNVFWQW